MGRWTPSFGVVGFLGLLAVHACSSDEDSSGDGKPSGGSGGDAGEAGAGAPSGGASGTAGGGRGGASGTDGTGGGGEAGGGGTAGQAGESPTGGVSGTAGQGGEGGTGAVGPGDACTMCLDGSAPVLQEECGTSPACTMWMDCVRGCSDAACLDACDRANRAVAPYQHVIYEAFCDACATDCAELELCDRDCMDNVNLVPTSMAPANLAATGLYETGTATPDQVAPYARPFQPEYELWSDGARKRRWAYIPPCERIGTGGMNRWIFPVGTRMWKEFSIPNGMGTGAVRVETRFIHRFGAGETDWIMAAYQWPMDNAAATAADAILAPTDGLMNANGTTHDIPSRAQCVACHNQTLPDKPLGFSAIQLSHMLAGSVTIQELADNGWLTVPAAANGDLARNGFDPPGDAATQGALGYLHANCGNCHNIGTTHGENPAAMPPVPPARLQLMVGSLGSLEETYVYTTLFDKPTTRPFFAGCDRIEPGSAAQSEVIMRMSRRDVQQMPPIGTEQVHAAAVAMLSAMIDAMPSTGTSACVPP